MEYLEEHSTAKRNMMYERLCSTAGSRRKENPLPITSQLYKQALLCSFESITPDEILRDRIVAGEGITSTRTAEQKELNTGRMC